MRKEERDSLLQRYSDAMTKNKIPLIVQKANLSNMIYWLKSGKKNQEDYALSVIESSEENFTRKKERKKATYNRKVR
jgi:hypothetical protein